MNYTDANREAWQEAFEVHQRGYRTDLAESLLDPGHSFLDEPVIAALRRLQVNGKVAGQLCCNNGRELLSIVKMGAQAGIGFDFAENYIREANRIAQVAKLNAQFVAADIAQIPAEFNETCDLLFVSAGALCWFSDLAVFFQKASQLLRTQGSLLIHEIHPFTNMIAASDEPAFDETHPDKVAYSYFKTDPWIENDGVDYVGKTQYKFKFFYSFSHTFSDIVNAIVQNRMTIEEMREYSTDISASFEQASSDRLPLSYLLTARKR